MQKLTEAQRQEASVRDRVERLERQAFNVENDGHVSAARAMREAATALTEARAEIERLTDLANKRWRETKTTQSELSILRARVREVVGGMLAHSCVADAGQDCKCEEDEAAERGARQLMEEVK